MLWSAASPAAQPTETNQRDGLTIIKERCVGCHIAEGNDSFSRISHQRKTPEGWLMTIGRMQNMRGLSINDEDRRTVVKYLADKQGLAPSETDGMRYAIERRLNTIKPFEQPFSDMCARCHTGARIALQRRPAQEWEHLINFHMAQFPSLEYHALARDRDWLPIAMKQILPQLASQYPLDSKAWTDWQATRPQAQSLIGQWSFSGHMPGKGELFGLMDVTNAGGDAFKVIMKGQYADGGPFNGEGSAVLYNGYEWRGNVSIDGVIMRQVFAASKGALEGRMFDKSHDERGLDFQAAQQGTQRLLGIQPGYLKAGGEAEFTLIGSGLEGAPDFGKGVEVVQVLEQTPERIKARIKAASDAAPGLHAISVGSLNGTSLAVYNDIASVKVVPEYLVARIGEGGGSTPKVQGRFDAEAWGMGADGKPYRIGVFPAQWKVEAFDERAKEDEDVKFAGTMQADAGVFTPGDAGPNPARKMSTNNAGNLKVIAAVNDAGKLLTGEGHMIVGVQRWNNPPIP
ncbi:MULTISPECIES: quinohemoprotein amine dehydrogenase subunit alpha [Pseudomonas]|uniref:quinohemoprotein amine dehydrogenase subunit alpha n=1 Tax=Pseudomonas TaxID=286 RepID=UPI002114119E|nr:quinohemoprotein amine dehydrogenase subunit alpha [Pseudomonas sp. MYb187]